jgi:hypothetical protein
MQNRGLRQIFIGLMTAASLATGGELDVAAAEQRVQEMVNRLELSDTQLEQLRPVMHDIWARQVEILDGYGIDPDTLGARDQSLGVRDAMAMRKDMMAVREDLRVAVGQFLNDEQMREFQAIQEERAAAMREKILARRHR